MLDTATIKAAVTGEKWATEQVIEHYTPTIEKMAIDEDMKQHLIMTLLEEFQNPSNRIKRNAGHRGHAVPVPGASL